MYVIQPIIWMRLLWNSRQLSSYRHSWLERYGLYRNIINSRGIILHAVSLGETLSAIPLIHALRKQYPGIVITLTTMTPTGLELAQSQCINYHNVYCSYLPYDLPGAMNRFIDKINPRLVIVMETELWPNLINILYNRNIPLIIVNARLSFHSFVRYRKFKQFMSLLMRRITLIVAQNRVDGARFIKLGFKKSKLFVTGNLKFDITITQKLLNQIISLKKSWALVERPIWIASSTHEGEEVLLLKAHKKLLIEFPNLLMILAPRHPERFTVVKKITEQAGLSYILYSSGISPLMKTQVVINDTIGKLMLLYGISDIAFIGGSLVKHGGHNPLEPAAHAIPIIMGPYTFNFHDICAKLREARGLITITNVTSLVAIISMLLINSKYRFNYGLNAVTVLKHNQGSLQRLLNILNSFLYI